MTVVSRAGSASTNIMNIHFAIDTPFHVTMIVFVLDVDVCSNDRLRLAIGLIVECSSQNGHSTKADSSKTFRC